MTIKLEDYVYVLNRVGGSSEDLPPSSEMVCVKIVPAGGEGVKAVKVVSEMGRGITPVYIVNMEADECIQIINPYTLPWYVKYYLEMFGIRWKI